MSGSGAPTGLCAPHATPIAHEIGPGEVDRTETFNAGKMDGKQIQVTFDPESEMTIIEDRSIAVEIDAEMIDFGGQR